jgi:acetyl-CoA carboxylase biotin carboxyl carrier protein
VTPDDWLDEVRRVLDHVRASDAVEVEVASPGFRLRLVRRPDALVSTGTSDVAIGLQPQSATDLATIVAPLTGVFYRSPSATVPPYVEVDDRVEPDTVVGLIETMKIFNEILAEQTGRVTAIVAETGKLVHAGDTLIFVDEGAESGNGQAPS